MEDDETFNEFNARLNAIVNDTFTLREPIPENRIVEKIMTSIPKRFDGKVVAIEENKTLNTMKVDELVVTYKLLKKTLGLMRRHGVKVLL